MRFKVTEVNISIFSYFQYECDPRDDMDSYQELCYEVGLDLEPNKYAKLRKQAMLAQEEQNDPMPWPLLFIGKTLKINIRNHDLFTR